LSYFTSPFFVKGFFKVGSHKLFALGWFWTPILLISASWVARITGVSRRRPALLIFLPPLAFPQFSKNSCFILSFLFPFWWLVRSYSSVLCPGASFPLHAFLGLISSNPMLELSWRQITKISVLERAQSYLLEP
jgi:hypothetical protein